MQAKIWASLVIFLTAAWAVYGQEDDQVWPGKVMLSGGFTTGGLFGGEQYKAFHDGIYPHPNSVGYAGLQVNARLFPMTHFGFELGSDLIGVVSDSYQTNNDLFMAVTSVYTGGVLFRLPMAISEQVTMDLFLGIGGNYHLFKYASDYIDIVENSGYTLAEVTPQLGYYFKIGGSLYLARPFFVVGELEYQKLRDQVESNAYQFDGDYFKINLRAGIDF